MLKGVSSLTTLVEAYKEAKNGKPKRLAAARDEFEKENGGKIVDSYFTPELNACAVLVGKTTRFKFRERRKLLVRLAERDISGQVPAFDVQLWRAIWMARRTERDSDYLLSRGPRMVVADMLYNIVVFLLGALDAAAPKPGEVCTSRGTNSTRTTQESLTGTASVAKRELDELCKYVEREGISTAVRLYLLGMPLGAAILAILTFIAFSAPIPDQRNLLVLAIVAGGIGSITSVMFRITQGQKLSVDPQQGLAVTIVAGMFRPIIGAVFGVALYVLVVGNLLPLDEASEKAHFYAGLAFLAGFVERWAQDTIVRSAPISPSVINATSGTRRARARSARRRRG